MEVRYVKSADVEGPLGLAVGNENYVVDDDGLVVDDADQAGLALIGVLDEHPLVKRDDSRRERVAEARKAAKAEAKADAEAQAAQEAAEAAERQRVEAEAADAAEEVAKRAERVEAENAALNEAAQKGGKR